MTTLPQDGLDPWALLPKEDKDPATERRAIELWGLPYEAALIPARKERKNVPSAGRPAFSPSRGQRIREEEALYRDEVLAITPNLFPFFPRQLVLWHSEGAPREPQIVFLERAFALSERCEGAFVCNTVGASATVVLSHGHLIARESPLLRDLPTQVHWEQEGLEFVLPAPGFPLLWAGVRGADSERRARAIHHLLTLRSSAAANILMQGDTAWLVPRRAEIPIPFFAHALGAAELWGVFVYPDQEGYEAADAKAFQGALECSCVLRSDAELASLNQVFEQMPTF